jgi:hypothetical protein
MGEQAKPETRKAHPAGKLPAIGKCRRDTLLSLPEILTVTCSAGWQPLTLSVAKKTSLSHIDGYYQ